MLLPPVRRKVVSPIKREHMGGLLPEYQHTAGTLLSWKMHCVCLVDDRPLSETPFISTQTWVGLGTIWIDLLFFGQAIWVIRHYCTLLVPGICVHFIVFWVCVCVSCFSLLEGVQVESCIKICSNLYKRVTIGPNVLKYDAEYKWLNIWLNICGWIYMAECQMIDLLLMCAWNVLLPQIQCCLSSCCCALFVF